MRILKFLIISIAIHVIMLIVLSHILTGEVEFPASPRRGITAEIFKVEPPKPAEPPRKRAPEVADADRSGRKSGADDLPSPNELVLTLKLRPKIERGVMTAAVEIRPEVREKGELPHPVGMDKLRREVTLIPPSSFHRSLGVKSAPPEIKVRLPARPSDELTDKEISPDLKAPLPGGKITKSMGIFSAYYAYGNGSNEGQVFGGFQMLMRRLGSDISSRIPKGKLDLIFIIDTSGSMRDNIRGIRAYTADLLNILRDEGYDLGLGLVTFADVRIERVKTRGITTDLEEFKNWLFKLQTEGGGDQPESTYEAIIAAIRKIDYRWFSRPYFILATDAPMHDKDIDGESEYSLDRIIEILRKKNIRMNVLGIDYLPLKQLAWGTGGEWFRIPGTGYTENLPQKPTDRSFAWLQGLCSIEGGKLRERIVISLPQPRPNRIEIKVKVLDPKGIRIFSNDETQEIKGEIGDRIVISPVLDMSRIARAEGIYTIIWRLRDDLGNEAILRRYVKIGDKLATL